MAQLRFKVEVEYDGKKLREYLKQAHGMSTIVIRRARRNPGGLTMNGEHIRTIDPVFTDCIVRVDTGEEDAQYLKADFPIPIAFENEDVIVFDKPPNMPCHPSKGHPYNTLANIFAANPSTNGLTFRCIGRLDSNTSGLVAVAKHPHACHMMAGNITKCYLAVVYNKSLQAQGTINAPIEQETEGIPIRIVREDGKSAVTHYNTLLACEKLSLMALWLETGRTHQIRVHMKHIGHTLIGDELYGGEREEIDRHALHCYMMDIPTSEGAQKAFSSLPQDMENLLLRCFSEKEIKLAICKALEFMIQ